MKKALISILILLLLFCMCTVAYADTGAGTVEAAASELVITMIVRVVGSLLITLIGALGAWLTVKIGRYKQLQNINSAINETIRAAEITVGELQQTVVDGLKAKAADGKLTKQEIADLGVMLLDKTKEKMSAPAYELLEAAQVDIDALITGVGESWIQRIKQADAPLPE